MNFDDPERPDREYSRSTTETGSSVVKTSGNAKQCAIYVAYTTATGTPVLGVPVTIATMNGEGMFMDVDGPLLLKNASGKVVQYSGKLPGVSA